MTDYEEIYRSARQTAFATGSHDRTPGYRATGLAAVVAAAKAEALEGVQRDAWRAGNNAGFVYGFDKGSTDPDFDNDDDAPVNPFAKDATYGDRNKAALVAAVAASKAETLAPILALHKPEKRFRPVGISERSWDTVEAAREHSHGDYEGVWSFEVCAECGRVELGQLREYADEWGYCGSLWPCKTFKATR